MRVLVITNMYPPHHYGGYEQLCSDVVRELRAAGHEVEVLTSDWRVPGVTDPDDVPGAVHRDLRMYWVDHEIVDPRALARLRIERHNHRRLAGHLDRFRPDVVSLWAMGALSLSLATAVADRGVPMVSVVCDDWLVYGPRIDAWHRAMRRRPRLDRLASAVAGVPRAATDIGPLATQCFISEVTESTALRDSPYPLPDRTLVYAGIDTDDFPVTSEAEDRPFGWRLLHVGRIDPRKGADTAIRSLAHLPIEATLTLVGRGDERHEAELRDLVDHLGLGDRVTFTVVPRQEVARWYREADVCAFPTRWAEPLGLVPVEAMACGTPVVATATGGSAEYLLDEVTCLRMPVDDPVAMAAAVRRFADDPELRRRVVDNGRLVAAELTMARWAELLERWHRHAVDPTEPRPSRRTPIPVLLGGT